MAIKTSNKTSELIDLPSRRVGPITNMFTRRSNLSSKDRTYDEVLVEEEDMLDGDITGDLTGDESLGGDLAMAIG